jgi:hypothetical protein
MHRTSAALTMLCLVCAAVLATPVAAGASGVSAKVTPNRGLVGGQSVTVSGRGLAQNAGGKPLTWFAAQCTAAVKGQMNPSTDTPHCDVTAAQGIRVRHGGTFSVRFRVRTGIIGDGYCGTPGHAGCVIGIGAVGAHGIVVRIWFKSPAPPATTTTSTSTSTTATSTTTAG